jgi:hypothetical protein
MAILVRTAGPAPPRRRAECAALIRPLSITPRLSRWQTTGSTATTPAPPQNDYNDTTFKLVGGPNENAGLGGEDPMVEDY